MARPLTSPAPIADAWAAAVSAHPRGEVGVFDYAFHELDRQAGKLLQQMEAGGVRGLLSQVLKAGPQENEKQILAGIGLVASLAMTTTEAALKGHPGLAAAIVRWENQAHLGQSTRDSALLAYGARFVNDSVLLALPERVEETRLEERTAAAAAGWRSQDARERAAALDSCLGKLLADGDPGRNPKGWEAARAIAGWAAERLDGTLLASRLTRLDEAREQGSDVWARAREEGASPAAARALLVKSYGHDASMLAFAEALENRVPVRAERGKGDFRAEGGEGAQRFDGQVEDLRKQPQADGSMRVTGVIASSRAGIPFIAAGAQADTIVRAVADGRAVEVLGHLRALRGEEAEGRLRLNVAAVRLAGARETGKPSKGDEAR